MGFKQLLSTYIVFCLLFTQVFSSGLQIDGTTKTTIDKSRNNIPIINIVNPSSSGLSHNKFKHYNVNKNGLILNNSKQTSIKTQLGGYIHGNKNLKTNAKVILNEITSTNRSYIKGFTEVAGKRADIVIANPNGISLNGAGFINSNSVTLTTGKPNILNGSISTFDIQKGDIAIEGAGLNNNQIDSTYIYSHYLKINAKINAKNLDIKLGQNKIDYNTKKIISSNNSGDRQNLLLDSSALGGMYANRISLVGTDKGLGVNLPPEVLASSGDIQISNDGTISLGKLNAKEEIKISSKSENIKIKNNIYSNSNVILDAKNKIINDGLIASQNKIQIKADQFINNYVLVAGLNEEQDLNKIGDLDISVNTLINNRLIQSTNKIDITSKTLQNYSEIFSNNIFNINSDIIENQNSIISNNQLNIDTKTLENNDKIYSNKILEIISDEIKNNKQIHSNDQLTITNTQKIINTDKITATKNLHIKSNILDTSNGEISSNNLKLQIDEIDSKNTNIIALNDMNIEAKNIKNKGTIQVKEKLTIDTKELTNKEIILVKDGEIKADKLINEKTIHSSNNLELTGEDITNKSTISSNNDITIKLSNKLDNTDANIISLNNLNISAKNFDNTQGEIFSNNINIKDLQELTNNSGLIKSNQNTDIYSNSISNNQGKIQTINNLFIDATTIDLTNSRLESKNNLTLRLGSLNNVASSYIGADGDIDIYSKSYINNYSDILAGRNFIILATRTLTNDQTLSAQGNLNFKANNLINNHTISSASGTSNINIVNKITNNARISSKTNLNIYANDIENNGNFNTGDTLNIYSNTLTNKQTLFSSKNMNLYTTNTLTNTQDSNIFALKNLKLARDTSNKKTDLIINDKGNIWTYEGDINIYAKTFENKTDKVQKTKLEIENSSIKLYPSSLAKGFFDEQKLMFATLEKRLKIFPTILKEFEADALAKEDYYNVNEASRLCDITPDWSVCKNPRYKVNDIIYKESEVKVIKFNRYEDEDNTYTIQYKDRSEHKDTLKKFINLPKEQILQRLQKYYKEKHNFKIGYREKNPFEFTGDDYDFIYYIDMHRNPEEIHRILTTKISEDRLVSKPSKYSKLASGRDMNIHVDSLINYLSEVSATRDINFLNQSGNIDNQSETLYRYSQTTGRYEYCYKDCGSTFHDADYRWGDLPTDTSKKVLHHVSSTIQAGRDINGYINKLNNGSIKQNQSISTTTKVEELSTKKGTNNIEQENIKGNIDNKNKDIKSKDEQTKYIIEAKKIAPKEDIEITLPKNEYGLFVYAKAPNAQHLIEINPEFTVYKNFLTSNYLMERLNFPSDITTKKVGDGFYENKLIRDSIFKQTGRRFLSKEITNDNEQFKYLMDNAIKAQKDLNLRVGITLTKEQINSLNQNIVWLEERIVAGQKVLVPVVYIASIDDYKLEGSKIIAGENINLKVAKLNNAGLIKSGKNAIILADDNINNIGGKIKSDKTLALLARNNINNISADIQAKQIDMKSFEGSIINKRFNENISYSKNTNIDNKKLLAKASNIIGEDINLEAKQNIDILGSQVEAKNLKLKAKNININSIVDQREYFEGDNDTYVKENSQTNISSKVQADNINIQAQDTTQIIASKLQAQDKLNIKTKDLLISSNEDRSYRETQAKTKGSFGATNTVKTKELNIKNIQSTLQAKNINIDSNNLKLIASTIKAKEAQITSQVMELITKKDSKFYSYFSDKSGGMTRTLHNKGSIKEALKEAKIQVDDKLVFNQKDISNKLSNENLIKTLSSQGNYTTEQIKLIKEVVNNKQWDDKTKSLSGVGGIVVAVVVSIVTAGAGAALVGGVAASTATTATTLVTTQTIQTAVVQSLVTGVTNQVATAALTGNNFKLDTKALVKGAVSAGVASYVNPAIYNQMGINSDSMDISDLAGRTMIDTTTQTAVSGGSFKDNLVTNSVNNLGAKVSNQIGGAYKDGELNYATHKLAHAATGAISAKLLGEDAASGALGAVTGEVIGEMTAEGLVNSGTLSSEDKKIVKFNSKIGTILTTQALGKDLKTALNASNIAVENNLVKTFSRPVIDKNGLVVNHLFGVVSQREDGKPDVIFSLGANDIIGGGKPIIEIKKVNNVTPNIFSNNTLEKDYAYYINNTYNDSQIITVPKGMTQYEFDELVLKNASLYNINDEINKYPNIYETLDATYNSISNINNNPSYSYRNSNTYIDNIIEQSGSWIKNFYNAPLQNAGEDNEKFLYNLYRSEGKTQKEINEIIRETRGFNNE